MSYEEDIAEYLAPFVFDILARHGKPLTLEDIHNSSHTRGLGLVTLEDVEFTTKSGVESELFVEIEDRFTGNLYTLASNADELVDRARRNQKSTFWKFWKANDTWLPTAIEKIKESYGHTEDPQTPTSTTAPASDRIVEFTDNQEGLLDAKAKTDEALEAVKALNDPGHFDEEVERVIREVESGRALLESQQVNIDLVERLLFEGLSWLGKRFADNAVNAVITTAIIAVAALLGIPIPG